MARTPFSRPDRVSSLIREVISELLLLEINDPRVKGVVVTDVAITGDLREAKIFVYCSDASRREAVMVGLSRASGWVRRELGKRIRLRVTPSVSFHFDESLEYGARIEARLRDLGLGEGETDSQVESSDVEADDGPEA